MTKTIQEINERIRKGEAVVVRADEVPELVKDEGAEKAAREVDVVTTGTFGAMCSSGAFFNLGHSNPPIRIQELTLNEVEAYAGLAAVDGYLGATQQSRDKGIEYGGGHVIEDFVAGRQINVKATSDGTDCYPRRRLETNITLEDLNQAYLYNPRNNYQKYNAAVNLSSNTLYTYMGTLLPHAGNLNFSGTGQISPLNNDPQYRSLGFGAKIFLGGAQGRIVGEGTQHNPKTGFGTIAVQGDLKKMSTDYLRGATIPGYGPSLFIGIGVPIPILDEDSIKTAAVTDDQIETNVLDYGVGRSDRPVVRKVKYSELLSGRVDINGESAKTTHLSSFRIAYKIMDELAKWISEGSFTFANEVESLPRDTVFKPMKVSASIPSVAEAMTQKVHTATETDTVKTVSEIMVEKEVDQIPVVDEKGRLKGIVTSLDITRAVSRNKKSLDEVMTKNVLTSKPGESVDEVSRRLEETGYNSTPVVEADGTVAGIITLSDINRIYGRLNK